jgi:peptidoglycan hydrolase-like protein with peptidoglycan-binding domain
MPMKTMTTFAIAVALVAAWSVAPAMATTTTTTPPAVEQKDTIGDKVERGVDKTKEKAGELKDKVVDTTKKAKDKVVDTTKKAKDKVVDKTDDATDKAADKTDTVKDKLAAKTEQMDVRHAQESLKDKGYDPGPIDGVHGPRTSAAVRDFQKKEGLTVTGRLDNETMGRLSATASGTGTVRTGSEGTAPASTSPAASPATGTSADPRPPAKQTR